MPADLTKGSTIYIKNDVLKKLQDLEVEFSGIKARTNSDKINFLLENYNKNKES